MRYVTVRVVDGSGRPVRDARVMVWVYQFAASGKQDEKWTNSEGAAEFSLDIDTFAEISINVNGSERVSRGSVRSDYKITI